MSTLVALGHGICVLCAIGAGVGCGYLLFAATVARGLPRAARRGPSPTPPVTILKPLHGAEPGLLAHLLSFCDQDYAGEIQIVFGCQERSDPAIDVARRVIALRPALAIDLVVDNRLHGSNRKVSNLIHCLARARHDVLVLADSDIEVDAAYLDHVVGALVPPGVGAVTCLYEGRGGRGGAALSALAINAHFLPNVLVGMALGAATPCFGSTIALRRETLDRIGGLDAVADKLADDYAIGAAVRRLGLRVAVPGFTVRHACAEPTVGAFLAHQLRFARTIRGIDASGHAGSLITNPLPLALIAALGSLAVAPWLIIAAVACRLVLVHAVATRFATAPQRLWLLPICDLALFIVLVASFCGTSVEWRGHRFHSLSDGSLVARRS